jgi:hypothetical protein
MKRRCYPLVLTLVALALGATVACSEAKNDISQKRDDAAATEKRLDVDPPDWFVLGSDSDAPRRFSARAPDFTGPSVAAGRPPGIDVGQYAPDFKLQPVELYPEFKELLGERSPQSFADTVHLSDLMGRRPVMLIFGSYT